MLSISSSSSFSLFRRQLQSLSLIPKPKTFSFNMSSSSRPSAFDALMSGARAAAKKSNPPPPSPKKRKSPTPISPLNPNSPNADSKRDSRQNPNPSGDTKCDSDSRQNPKPSGDTKCDVTKEEKASNGVVSGPEGGALGAKRMRVVGGEERIKEMKEKAVLLKRKPAEFEPSVICGWEKGEAVPFLFLCLAFDVIAEESGRIVITDIVCNMLRTVMYKSPEDLVATVYLSANKIAPAHEGLELGIGDTSIIKALAGASGSNEAQIKAEYKKKGDLGLVAKSSRSTQPRMPMGRRDPLTIRKVFNTFHLIAKESGRDSQERKKDHIKRLLVAATDCEPQYLIRLLQSKLRIGYAEQTLLAALGQAAVYTEGHSVPPPEVQSPLEEAAKIVKQVYSVLPVYDKIIPALLSGGVWKLTETCNFTPGVPVGPMLSKATKGVSEVLNKFQDVEFTCEYKYDGERAQIHYMDGGSVEVYSRNAERNTGKFPDVVAAISRLKKPSVTSFVLDCELVAYDREKKKILPFQVLSTRARKNVTMSDIKVNVCIFAFDILYLNGKPLLQENLKVRREYLYGSFEEEAGFFQFATAITSNDVEEIQKFLDAAVDASNEGLIIKTLCEDATYEPSKRSLNWLKLKKDYLENIGDSLDLVPIAAFHGRGKRTGVYGAFLLACYDSNGEEFQSICKIGTGFSEAMLEERSASLRSKVIPQPKSYYRFAETMNPDVWFEASEVWEVKAADLTISPVHRAAVGIVDSDKGISLRFPRLVRVRDDKAPEQATSSDMVAEMYHAQKHNHPNNQDDDED